MVMLVLIFLIACGSQSQAFWWEKEKKAKEPSEAEEVIPKVVEKKKPIKQTKEAEQKIEELDAKRALIENKRKELNDTEWQIEMSLLGSTGGKQSDIITFSNNRIASANLLRQGFSATNYTLTVEEAGEVIWETMQTSEKLGVAFWRGEIDANFDKMRGVFSHRIDDETTQDYAFRSISKKAISPSVAEE